MQASCACKLAVQSQSLVPQVFNSNMSKKSEPKITSCKSSDNWTSITFSPDLAKFGMESLEEHAVMLMRKRVYDMAGVLGKTVKVALITHVALTCQHANKLCQCLSHCQMQLQLPLQLYLTSGKCSLQFRVR